MSAEELRAEVLDWIIRYRPAIEGESTRLVLREMQRTFTDSTGIFVSSGAFRAALHSLDAFPEEPDVGDVRWRPSRRRLKRIH